MSTYQVIVTLKKDSEDTQTISDRTFTLTGGEYIRTAVVNNTNAILWDTTQSGTIADFDLLVINTDQPVNLEFTTNEGNANEELSSIPLAKNVALVLGADDSYFNHSASDAFAGTLNVIDKIRVEETNSVNATVTLRLYT